MYDQEMLKEFIIESNEHLTEFEESLNRLIEQPESKENINELFRSVHSIKGSANYIGLAKTGDFLHAIESCLERVRQGKLLISRNLIDVLFAAMDIITALLNDLSEKGEELTDTDGIINDLKNLVESGENGAKRAEPAGGNDNDLSEDRREAGSATGQKQNDYGNRKDIFGDEIGEILNHHMKDLEEGLEALEQDMTVDQLNRFLNLVGSFSSSIEYFGYDELKNALAGMRNSALALLEEGESINNTELMSFFKARDYIKDYIERQGFREEEPIKKYEDAPAGELTLAEAVKEFTIIPGVGGSKAKLLYEAGFRSLESLGKARIEKLESVEGINLKLAKDIAAFFKHEDKTSPKETGAEARDLSPANREATPTASDMKKEVVEDLTAGHDEELIDIFLSATVDLFSIIERHLEKIQDKTADKKTLTDVLDVLSKLRRSAHYMEYGVIVERLDSTRELIENYMKDRDAFTPSDMTLLINGLLELKNSLRKSRILAQKEETAHPSSDMNQEDRELLEIFLSAAEQYMDTINTCLSHIKEGQNIPEMIEIYKKALESLKSSAKFMGYNTMIETLDAQLSILNDQAGDVMDGQMDYASLERQYTLLKKEVDAVVATMTAPVTGQDIGAAYEEKPPINEKDVPSKAGTGADKSDESKPLGRIQEGLPSGGDIKAAGGSGEGPPPSDDGESQIDIAFSRQTLRVETERIDTIMNLVGELVVNRASFSQLISVFREVYRELLDLNKLNKRELSMLRQLALDFESSAMELGRVSNDLQEGVMRVRMVVINQLFSRFPRLVRDLADKMDKDVRLTIHGKETELDKSVIEEISDPLIHIIRNSIDHGIESREERKKKKKPEEGNLTISAYHQGNQVIIDITDDGRGIDIEEVKNRMIADGDIAPQELPRISNREALDYLFKPGVSLAKKVSNVSGRGVGLDIVKKNIEKMKGNIEIITQKDVGTSFVIKLPLTLAIIQALIVEIAGRVYSIPLSSIMETVRVNVNEIETIEGHQVLRLRDKVLPLLSLSEIFKINTDRVDDNQKQLDYMFVVILAAEGREVGLIVDRMIGEENIVIKSLEKYLANTKGVSGASIMGDGSISLILDVIELVNLAIERERAIRKNQAKERYASKRKRADEHPTKVL